MVSLSVLDLATVTKATTPSQALAECTELARVAETTNYKRFWVAEHHGMAGVASSAPAVLLAHLASHTEQIRVGAGGVMLPNHAPLVIAEQFGTLEALHPGRIDLGLGRAPGTDPRTARALGRGDAERFPDDVLELMSYFTGEAPIVAMPGRGNHPELWLLGSSTYSAQLAGYLGLPFSFAYHFAPDLVHKAVELYRSSFRPSAVLAEPHLMIAVTTLCAQESEEAAFLAGPMRLSTLLLRTGRPEPMSSPEDVAVRGFTDQEEQFLRSATANHVVGAPKEVIEALDALATSTGADELLLSTRAFAVEDRIRSLQLIAGAFSENSPQGY